MSIKQYETLEPLDTIDVVAVDPKSGVAQLMISMDGDRANQPLDVLKNYIVSKVNSCAWYANSGQLYDDYPADRSQTVRIRILFEEDIDPETTEFLETLVEAVSRVTTGPARFVFEFSKS